MRNSSVSPPDVRSSSAIFSLPASSRVVPSRVVSGAERVLELVAVAPLLEGGHDLAHRRIGEAADALERVCDLALLFLELALVRQHLPRRARMRCARLDPVGRRLEHLDRTRLA